MYEAPMTCNVYAVRQEHTDGTKEVQNRKRISFPAFTQPKLNGVRGLYNGQLAWTRNQKDHKSHILSFLQSVIPVLPSNTVLDGELILPHPYTFQDTVSAVKRLYDLSHHLVYHVFDCFFPDAMDARFDQRYRLLEHLQAHGRVHRVETTLVHSDGEVDAQLDRYLELGYEGAIIRTAEGVYKHGPNGSHLLKYKQFIDREYPIIDVWEGIDKFAGMAVFRMPCPWYSPGDPITEKNSFGATAPGDFDEKRHAWEHREEYIGKMLTVKFQNLSDEGVPIFPIALAIRDYE